MTGDTWVERLRELDTCAVSDACDQLGLADRVSTRPRPLTGPARIAGRVITVELGPSSGGPATHHLCASAVGTATADDVIVIAHQGREDSAGWGGNLSRAALVRAVAGTVIDGATRDLDEAIEIGYVVFATATTPQTARSRTEEKAWAGTIVFDGVSVDHGDFVVADSSGVVFVPAADVDRVLSAAEAIAANEAAMAGDIDAGAAISQVMGTNYETMLE